LFTGTKSNNGLYIYILKNYLGLILLYFILCVTAGQTAGQSYNIKIDNKSFERVEQFIYLGTTLTNQNSIQEKIMSRLKSGYACYCSEQTLSSCSLLSKNMKIKTIILTVVMYGCGTWSHTLRELRLRVSENKGGY
jgi:hypothetical protein